MCCKPHIMRGGGGSDQLVKCAPNFSVSASDRCSRHSPGRRFAGVASRTPWRSSLRVQTTMGPPKPLMVSPLLTTTWHIPHTVNTGGVPSSMACYAFLTPVAGFTFGHSYVLLMPPFCAEGESMTFCGVPQSQELCKCVATMVAHTPHLGSWSKGARSRVSHITAAHFGEGLSHAATSNNRPALRPRGKISRAVRWRLFAGLAL